MISNTRGRTFFVNFFRIANKKRDNLCTSPIVKENVAETFLTNNKINEVIAWDGTVLYFKFLWFSGKDILSLDQDSFYNYASNEMVPFYYRGEYYANIQRARAPMGEVHYSRKADGTIVRKNKSGKEIVKKENGGYKTK